MSVTKDLFKDHAETPPSKSIAKWLVVTNQRNLFYMLGTGLIMPPSGFGGKYYEDTLSCFPGWLPLFPDQVPEAAIEVSVKEKKHLIPCILEMNLSSLQGPAKAVGPEGIVTDINFPDDVTGHESFMLVPAPLPITWTTTVHFKSNEDKVACKKDAGDFDNVDLSVVMVKVLKKIFTKTSSVAWPQQVPEISEREVSLERPLAAGGILAMLTHLGNKGNLAIDAAKLSFDQMQHHEDIGPFRIIKTIPNWYEMKQISKDQGVDAQLYWGLMDRLIKARAQTEGPTAADAILAALMDACKELDEKAREAIEKLIEDLKGISGLSDNTVSELLERHPKPLPRALLLFFLNDSCSEFLAFRHHQLNEYDTVSAAMLFGVKESWLGLPSRLRKVPGLKEACCHRMAIISHEMTGSSVELGAPPERPQSVRELLGVEPWKKHQHEAALLLARKCGWDGIHTRVSLGKGQYRLEIDGQGAHFVLEGEPKSVQTTVDYQTLMTYLTTETIPEKVEHAVRVLLKGK